MSIYGDDQCEECGAVRVAGSKLCPQYLVRTVTRLEDEVTEKREEIEGLEKKIKEQEKIINSAISHGFRKNQENIRLKQHIKKIQIEIERGMNDETNG